MMARRIDAHPSEGITVRFFPDRPEAVEIFYGGWRTGIYRTARGVQNALARLEPFIWVTCEHPNHALGKGPHARNANCINPNETESRP